MVWTFWLVYRTTNCGGMSQSSVRAPRLCHVLSGHCDHEELAPSNESLRTQCTMRQRANFAPESQLIPDVVVPPAHATHCMNTQWCGCQNVLHAEDLCHER
jgi:hypothetical protein